MSRTAITGHFIAGPKGRIFVLLRRPAAAAAGCVLVVPPFAEEMNKCRRMVTEAAIGLSAMGIASVVPDLYGTGDSEGDFADGDWATWQADVARAASWAAEQGLQVTAVLAIRLGCALAAACALSGAIPAVTRSVLWQPAFDGGRFLGQFLRLRVAASLMEGRKETLAELRQRLQAGADIEVAGYMVSGRLAADLDALKATRELPTQFGDVLWLEVLREQGSTPPPAAVQLIEQARASGGRVQARSVTGEAFWSSTEIVLNKDILSATLDHCGGTEPDASA